MDDSKLKADGTSESQHKNNAVLGEVSTWQSWAKRNKPQRSTVQDSSLGFVYTIEPTLKRLGFHHTREERDEDCSPREQVLSMVDLTKYKEVVYYVYNHSRGYCSYVEVFFR